MIVKIMSRGKSFSGVAAYLTHDPDQAKTAERVAWTHTHNLANDDVPCAVNEMLWTARDAELLKQEAGVRAGGRATEDTAKHVSLNWSPEDRPTQEHMVETAENFLRHMQWQDHQAIFVAHNDKPYAHVHVILNVVHPETGLCLDEGFERRRAQAWALEYEREQGRIYCEQRLKNPADRENNMPRNIWMDFRENEKEFERAEKSLRKNEPIYVDPVRMRANSEWEILKEMQRNERIEFFAQGKSEFKELRNSIYREVREEFRERWSDYYAAKREGADPDTLAALKSQLTADQKAVLEGRRDEACNELRESRDGRYRELLDGQREARAELRGRQEIGLDNAAFLNELPGRQSARDDLTGGFHEAANETGRPQPDGMPAFAAEASDAVEHDEPRTLSGGGGGRSIEHRVSHGVVGFFDSLAFDLINLGSARPRAAAADRFERPQPHRGRRRRSDQATAATRQGRGRRRMAAKAKIPWRMTEGPVPPRSCPQLPNRQTTSIRSFTPAIGRARNSRSWRSSSPAGIRSARKSRRRMERQRRRSTRNIGAGLWACVDFVGRDLKRVGRRGTGGFLARKALREKRAAERRAHHALRLSRMPADRASLDEQR